MKWTSHKICTLGTVTLLSGNVFYGLVTMLTSCVPDMLEGKPPDMYKDYKGYWAWRSRHRKYSHWFVLYVLMGMAYASCRYFHIIPANLFKYTDNFYFLILGCLMHILEDAICGKVPRLNWNKKIGVKLFTVGSWQEYAFVVATAISGPASV